MTALAVRAAGPDDLDLLVRANLALAAETEDRALDGDRVRRGVRRALDDPQRGSYWIAELDGRPVGSLLVTREWSDWRDGWFWWIQSVWVEPAARRRGVYAALHRAVEAAALRSGDAVGLRLYVAESNEPAQAVYARLGMQEAGYRLYEAPLGG